MNEPNRVTPTSLPASLRWAIGLVFGEAVVMAVITGLLIYATLAVSTANLRGALLVVAFAATIAGLLALCGWGLLRRRAWARGPAVVLELMLLPIGWFMIAAGRAWLGIPIFLLGIVGAGLLVAPASREALSARRP